MQIASLPSDIFILVLENLTVAEIVALSQTCRNLHTIVTNYGWMGYLHSNPRPSNSLSLARATWTTRDQVRYDHMSDKAWSLPLPDFIARPLSRPWMGRFQGLLVSSPSRLLAAAGHTIHSYRFSVNRDGNAPGLRIEGLFNLPGTYGTKSDISGLAFLPDDGQDPRVAVGFTDGTIECLKLDSTTNSVKTSIPLEQSDNSSLISGDAVESISADAQFILSLCASGIATLYARRNAIYSPCSTVRLNARSWTSYLCMDASTPYIAFGTSSSTPLSIYSIHNDQISSKPKAIMHASRHNSGNPDPISSTAVYGLSRGPPAAPWGASPQVLVTGWFDGTVRFYDLRSSSRLTPTPEKNAHSVAPLRPVLSLRNPWSEDAIYSVSCGGGAGAHVAAGSSCHSVVSFWDVRSPKTGWSVFAPGNDPSPVYSVILESSRCFGVTQSRPFVLDFGPGVTAQTYPPIPQRQDGLRRAKGSHPASFYVTQYSHQRT